VVASNGVSPAATAGPFVVTVASASNKTADLAVAMTAPATAAKGSIVTYTIVVTNNGPATATDGTLLLLVGPDAAFVSASPSPFINFDGVMTWPFRRLDSRQSLTYTLRLKLTKAGTVAAIAGVASDVRDPKPADNVAVVKTTVK
jgi:uncharacterized repeat protein (TIGR01451 family)